VPSDSTKDTISSVGHLDIILIPGSDIALRPSQALQSFLQTRLPELKALLLVCTGSIIGAFAGLLEGKTATAPRIVLPMLKKSLPNVKWVEERWANDGNIWTSGLVTNGIDMVTAFIREEYPELAEVVCEVADVPERSGKYEKPLSVLAKFSVV
jgi:transcriptional regulator GlxA family with amidase domain